jgi:hypothetical protein
MADDNEKTAREKPPAHPLLNIQSPPLSPASEITDHVDASGFPALEALLKLSASSRPRVRLQLRRRRNAMLAASVAASVMVGIVAGMAMGAIIVTPAHDRSAVADRDAMQESIAVLREDIGTLKADFAAAEKATVTAAGKTAERFPEAADITGSISLPSVDAPLPAPRPAIAGHAQIVRGWWISSVREGFVYVQGGGGVFQVQPGAPLPGLGPVQDVAFRDGYWAVRTPKGLIVSLRDRRHFERF